MSSLIGAIAMYEETKLDKYIEKYCMITLVICMIIAFISIWSFWHEWTLKVLVWVIIIQLMFDLTYGFHRAGKMKYLDETKSQFYKRTGKKYFDNTPKDLTLWKTIKIYYRIEKDKMRG